MKVGQILKSGNCEFCIDNFKEVIIHNINNCYSINCHFIPNDIVKYFRFFDIQNIPQWTLYDEDNSQLRYFSTVKCTEMGGPNIHLYLHEYFSIKINKPNKNVDIEEEKDIINHVL